jgi:hypothetical protein
MGFAACNGAVLQCTFGAMPSTLAVLPINRVTSSGPLANIMDNKPVVNILPFGMCNSIANPTVASATAAALGVLTPMPCVPVTAAPWAPGSPTILIGNQPALTDACKCFCNWGGVISINFAGQTTIQMA